MDHVRDFLSEHLLQRIFRAVMAFVVARAYRVETLASLPALAKKYE